MTDLTQILKVTAARFGVLPEAMTRRGSLPKRLIRPRQVAIALAMRLARLPVRVIAAEFGGLSVSMVRLSARKVDAASETDPSLRAILMELLKKLEDPEAARARRRPGAPLGSRVPPGSLRPCMCCRLPFPSEGAHNRLCSRCRWKSEGYA